MKLQLKSQVLVDWKVIGEAITDLAPDTFTYERERANIAVIRFWDVNIKAVESAIDVYDKKFKQWENN